MKGTKTSIKYMVIYSIVTIVVLTCRYYLYGINDNTLGTPSLFFMILNLTTTLPLNTIIFAGIYSVAKSLRRYMDIIFTMVIYSLTFWGLSDIFQLISSIHANQNLFTQNLWLLPFLLQIPILIIICAIEKYIFRCHNRNSSAEHQKPPIAISERNYIIFISIATILLFFIYLYILLFDDKKPNFNYFALAMIYSCLTCFWSPLNITILALLCNASDVFYSIFKNKFAIIIESAIVILLVLTLLI